MEKKYWNQLTATERRIVEMAGRIAYSHQICDSIISLFKADDYETPLAQLMIEAKAANQMCADLWEGLDPYEDEPTDIEESAASLVHLMENEIRMRFVDTIGSDAVKAVLATGARINIGTHCSVSDCDVERYDSPATAVTVLELKNRKR